MLDYGDPWSLLYSSVLGEISLDQAFGRAIAATGAECGLVVSDQGGVHLAIATDAPAEAVGALERNTERNLWISRRPRQYAAFHRTTDYVSTDEWLQSEGFRDLLKKGGMEMTFGLVASARLEGSELVVLLGRPRDKGLFSDAEIAIADRLLPHLVRVVQIRSQLDRAAVTTAFQDSAIDSLALAILRVDETGKVLYHNRLADELLRRSEGMVLRDGQLSNAATQRLIGELAGSHRNGQSRLFNLRLDEHQPPVLAVSTPLMSNGVRQFMIAISDAGLQSAAIRGHLTNTFKLSPAELELALELFNGQALAEIAASRQLSINTLRVQLRGILKKTGVNRQTGLVAMIGRIPPVRLPLSA